MRRPKENLKTSKEEIPNSDELSARNRAAGAQQGQRQQVTETIIREKAKIGRNEKVTIKNILSGDNSNYIRFISSGGSDYPINIMKKAGIDMTRINYLENAMKIFEQKLNQFEQELG